MIKLYCIYWYDDEWNLHSVATVSERAARRMAREKDAAVFVKKCRSREEADEWRRGTNRIRYHQRTINN